MRVGELARLAGLTVRTLHHYDEIGLLVPSGRSEAGYRLYREPELARLQQILVLRELGFELGAIRRLVDDPGFDRRTALEAQRELLVERVRKTEAIIRAVDATLEAMEGGREMDAGEMFEGFDGFDAKQYEAEARERWGHTAAYRESMRRTRRYGKAEWEAIRVEGDGLMAEFAALLAAGRRPDGPEAMALAERHRLHIDRWFYPCDHAMHSNLAELYTSDPRFGEYFEQRGAGLTAFVSAAIRANGERAAQARR